jgi:hypothetical protein
VANCGHQSKMIVNGMLCNQQMYVMNTLRNCFVSMSIQQGIRCYLLVKGLMTTQIVSHPFDYSRPVTKSTNTSCQGLSRIGRVSRHGPNSPGCAT